MSIKIFASSLVLALGIASSSYSPCNYLAHSGRIAALAGAFSLRR